MIEAVSSAKTNPLVSCLCVSYKRAHLLQFAIECFLQQTYDNKEMVVVHNVKDVDTIALLESFADNKAIVPVMVDTKGRQLTLGDLRNIAVDCAHGDYVCTWDDDDWYGPARIQAQMASLQALKKNASVMTSILMYNKSNDTAYLSFRHPWEPTLLVEKKVLTDNNIRYPQINKSEDTVVLRMLAQNYLIAPTLDPRLYIYLFNGQNTCSEEHFNNIYRFSQQLSPYQTHVISSAINGKITPVEAELKMNTTNFMMPLDLLI